MLGRGFVEISGLSSPTESPEDSQPTMNTTTTRLLLLIYHRSHASRLIHAAEQPELAFYAKQLDDLGTKMEECIATAPTKTRGYARTLIKLPTYSFA